MVKDFFWIDNLRAIATLSVILLHVSASAVSQFGLIDMNTWWVANIVDGTVRFSVPIFFMISGALLLSKDYTLSAFYKKRFFRLIPPFIFWSLVYITFALVIKGHNGETMSLIETLKFFVIQLYKGSSHHLWFVYAIIGLYLTIPILRIWIKNSTNKEILYFLSIWGGIIFFNYSYLEPYKPTFNLIFFTGYIGYMVLGYFLSHNKSKILNNKWAALAMIIVGSLITIFGTYALSKKINSFDTSMYVYLTPNVALSAVGFFLFFKNLKIKSKVYIRVVKAISKNSYGIYLIHILVLKIISKVGINWKMTTPFLSIIVVACICLSISSIIIYIMKRTKVLKKVAG